ncbi:MAG: hypothetical protein IPG09_04635 [Ignavibacteria bacterium]|nr:hypothetical protein [Ignavibacteria bacterium]
MKKKILIFLTLAFAFQTADAQITALNQNRSHFISGKSGIGGGYSDRGELVQQNSNGGNINNLDQLFLAIL